VILFAFATFVLIVCFAWMFASISDITYLHITREDDSVQMMRIPERQPVPEPVARPDEGWHGVFDVPRIFSYDELRAIIEVSPHYTRTRPATPHPNRQMTESERGFWIDEYNLFGGINSQEFEIYKIINEIRAEYGLPPFVLCPRLSKASRLFSYLQVREHSVGHTDPYYGDLITRSNFFGAQGTLYMENANSQVWQVMPDGAIRYVYLYPQGLVDGWMESPDHRAHILTTDTTHAGFGVDSGNNRVVPTMKTIMPR
jgi:uncharacterized protein YkwD